MKKIATARTRVRRHVWAQLPGGVPASKVAGTVIGKDVIVLDIDATIVVTHSEKEQAAPTFKRTFGFHPLGEWCDNTSEFLAAKLRAGNAGSNTATDHIEVLTDAIAQIPAAHRKKLLIRSDGAGASHKTPGLARRTEPGPGPERGVLRGVRDHRQDPRRDRPGPEEALDPGAGC